MERLSKEQIEAVIQEAKERCPYYGEPDGCNASGGPLMCCDELDEVGELAKAACALGTVEELAALVKAQDEGPMAGDSVYVLERDEYGEAADVSGLMFLAVVGHCAILSPYIDEIEDLDETMEDHIRETAENMSTDLYVYPIEDVYLTRAEAEAAR